MADYRFSRKLVDAMIEELFPTPESLYPFRDVYYEVYGVHLGDDELRREFRFLPKTDQCDILRDGLSDLRVRHNLYTHWSCEKSQKKRD